MQVTHFMVDENLELFKNRWFILQLFPLIQAIIAVFKQYVQNNDRSLAVSCLINNATIFQQKETEPKKAYG